MKTKKYSYIGSVNSSAKIAKGEKVGIDTFVIYLAPADLSGFNTCPKSTAECRQSCLFTSGRVLMDKKNTIVNARINKTIVFFTDRISFMNQLVKEISKAKVKSEKEGKKFAVRLNGTSDISPLLFTHNNELLFDIFPDVQFYDYTKVSNRANILKDYGNYHLTFSYSGHNWDECEKMLSQGISVAMVFDIAKGQELPSHYMGYKVIDGDITDYRPDDAKGVIVGLRYKKIRGGKVASKFIVRANELINQ